MTHNFLTLTFHRGMLRYLANICPSKYHNQSSLHILPSFLSDLIFKTMRSPSNFSILKLWERCSQETEKFGQGQKSGQGQTDQAGPLPRCHHTLKYHNISKVTKLLFHFLHWTSGLKWNPFIGIHFCTVQYGCGTFCDVLYIFQQVPHFCNIWQVPHFFQCTLFPLSLCLTSFEILWHFITFCFCGISFSGKMHYWSLAQQNHTFDWDLNGWEQYAEALDCGRVPKLVFARHWMNLSSQPSSNRII